MKIKIPLLTTIFLFLLPVIVYAKDIPEWQTFRIGNTATYASDIKSDSKGNLYLLGYAGGMGPWLHLIFNKSIDQGKNWMMLDNFYVEYNHLISKKIFMTKDNFYLTAISDHFWVEDPRQMLRWKVRKSVNDGKAWSTIDIPIELQLGPIESYLLEVAPNGDMYACYDVKSEKSIVLKSSDEGSTWNKVYENVGHYQEPRALIFDSRGAVYILIDKEEYTYIVKSEDNGKTWSDFAKPIDHGESGKANFAVTDKDGNIYMLVAHGDRDERSSWEVYKIMKDGSTSILDHFSKHPLGMHVPTSMFIDKNGALYVTGWYKDPEEGKNPKRTIEKGITRISMDKGKHWEMFDDYAFHERGVDFPTWFRSITVDLFGNIYVAGDSKAILPTAFVRRFEVRK